MELTFITSALRRYWWFVVVTILVLSLPALLLSRGGGRLYRSEAVLLVMEPSESQLTVSVGGDADRYIAGQLSVLRSQVMAERVAEELADGSSRTDISTAVSVNHEPGTDVVTIAADTVLPERSQAIVRTYVDVYFRSIRAQLDGTLEPVIASIDQEIEVLTAAMEEVDEAMVAAVLPYLQSDPIPTLDQIAPGLITQKALLLTRLDELQSSSTRLQFGPRVASEIVQSATLPTDPESSRRSRLLPVALGGGLFLGLLGAVVLARFSRNVVTDDQAEEILDQALVGHVPSLALARTRPALLDPVPEGARRFIEGLAVRAGSTNPSGMPVLSVVVTGSQRGAGTTTVAAMLARSFVESGSRVLLVDADRQDPELTRLFVTGRDTVEMSSSAPQGLAEGAKRRRPEATTRGTMVPTAVPDLYVADLDRVGVRSGPGSERTTSSSAARRLDVQALLESLPTYIDIVVFDGGPLLGAVSTVQLAHHCNAVVLTMPHRQSIRGLEVVVGEMGDRSFLPVWTPATRRVGLRGRGSAGSYLPASNEPADDQG